MDRFRYRRLGIALNVAGIVAPSALPDKSRNDRSVSSLIIAGMVPAKFADCNDSALHAQAAGVGASAIAVLRKSTNPPLLPPANAMVQKSDSSRLSRRTRRQHRPPQRHANHG